MPSATMPFGLSKRTALVINLPGDAEIKALLEQIMSLVCVVSQMS